MLTVGIGRISIPTSLRLNRPACSNRRSSPRSPPVGRSSPKACSPLLPTTPVPGAGLILARGCLFSPATPSAGRGLLPPAAASVSAAVQATATNGRVHATNGTSKHYANGNGNGNGNGHSYGPHSNGNGNGSVNGNGNDHRGRAATHPAASGTTGVQDAALVRDAASTVRVHLVVPRCVTVPGEHMVLVGDCDALGRWDVRKGVKLHWCSGHMHSATFVLPADWQSFKAKLVLVHGALDAKSNPAVTWEGGNDRSIVLQPPRSSGDGGNGVTGKAQAPVRAVAHDYVVVCHWGHTDASSVLAREVPGEVLVLEQQLSQALAELRTARTAAAASQERLQRMAQDLASSERAARQGSEQLAELQAKHDAMKVELADAKRQAKAAAAEAAAATAAAAAATQASSINAAEVEARVSQRYEGRMAELKQQLEGVKSQYSAEVSALQQKLEASLSKEVEAQEMVITLREIVQKDVARLRTELSQLVNEYIAARQQLADQAQQIEASEKLRMQQIDGLSSEIKNLITKYNNAQSTIAEQQRLLEELQASRGVALPPRSIDPVQHMTVPPAPDSQAGRGWRADWARLSKLTANGTAATQSANTR